jgi:hypothetical protein
VNIQVDIERLVLDGINLSYRERQQLGAGLESELRRLLAQDGPGAKLLAGSALRSVPAGAIEWTPGGDPTALGKQIAHSVYEGLRK